MGKIAQHLTSAVFTPAVVCYLVRNGKALLGHRKAVSLGLGKDLIAGYGGKRGDKPEYRDETDEEAATRELREEAQIEVKSLRKMGRVRFIWPHKPKWNQDVTIFVVDEWEGEPVETPAMQPLWFDFRQLPTDQMWQDNAFWVPRVLAGEVVDAIFLYSEDSVVVEYVFE